MFCTKIVIVLALTSLAVVQARNKHRKSSTTTTTTPTTTYATSQNPSVSSPDPAIVAAIIQANAAFFSALDTAKADISDVLDRVNITSANITASIPIDDDLQTQILQEVNKVLVDLQSSVDAALALAGTDVVVVPGCRNSESDGVDAIPVLTATHLQYCIANIVYLADSYYARAEYQRDSTLKSLFRYYSQEMKNCWTYDDVVVEEAVDCIHGVMAEKITYVTSIVLGAQRVADFLESVVGNLHGHLLKCNIGISIQICVADGLQKMI